MPSLSYCSLMVAEKFIVLAFKQQLAIKDNVETGTENWLEAIHAMICGFSLINEYPMLKSL